MRPLFWFDGQFCLIEEEGYLFKTSHDVVLVWRDQNTVDNGHRYVLTTAMLLCPRSYHVISIGEERKIIVVTYSQPADASAQCREVALPQECSSV